MSLERHYSYDNDEDEEVCPDYNAATRISVRRSNTVATASSGATSSSASGSGSASSGSSSGHGVQWDSPFDAPRCTPPLRSFSLPQHQQNVRRAGTPLRAPRLPPTAPLRPLRLRPERYLYTYTMRAGGAPLTFFISVEPENGKPTPGTYTLRLSLKADDVERPIGDPVELELSIDPRTLDFTIFLFPGKNNVVPAGCLYSLRVWLRAGGVDHRVLGEDELWVGAEPDFGSVADASFANLRLASGVDSQVYDAVVGRARVQFIIRWHSLGDRYFRYTMEYTANGVGKILMNDLRLRVDGDPRRVAFLIYTIPVRSAPAGASHRLRVWLKTRALPPDGAAPSQSPAVDAHVYQRVWKSDAFKIGHRLDFQALGPSLVMGVRTGAPQTIVMEVQAPSPVAMGYQRDTKTLV
ncbi:hypothetical protein C8F04DRAFT_1102373 [Mycena alexandri]|uniref:Uncharacterized protein n=1 Tax=Mycena alexandri TaxID=1745969 RepID=A0AAD6SUW7_9AGAR|nr:hypothetical protein C8F04DRAFT_1102373 [Mycena alexandri]